MGCYFSNRDQQEALTLPMFDRFGGLRPIGGSGDRVELDRFVCRSYNYKDCYLNSTREHKITNCGLSDRDKRELDLQSPFPFSIRNIGGLMKLY